MFSIFKTKEIVCTIDDEMLPLILVYVLVGNTRKMKMQCVAEDTKILIGDIISVDSRADKNANKGYGSKMMEMLLKYALKEGYNEVYGNLSVVDLDHKDRLHHFYEKFGFTIVTYDKNEGNFYGKVIKQL